MGGPGGGPEDEADESTVEAEDELVYRSRAHTRIPPLETEASRAGCKRRPIILMNSPAWEPRPFTAGLSMLAEAPRPDGKLVMPRHNHTYSC